MLSNHLTFCHPFSSWTQSLSASGSFLVSWLFVWRGQSIGVPASASVLPMDSRVWFSFRLTCLISLQSKGDWRVFSSITIWKHQFFGAQSSLWSNSHIITWLLEKPQHWLCGICQQNDVSAFCFLFLLFPFIFISWVLITLQYCSGFCHTLTWMSHGVTCIPHPDPPSYLPLYPIPLGLPSAPGLSTCLMHPAWAGDLFHYR